MFACMSIRPADSKQTETPGLLNSEREKVKEFRTSQIHFEFFFLIL